MDAAVYQVDAFTKHAFGGGPAIIFVVEDPELSTDTYLRATQEFQQPVASFLSGSNGDWQVRFFDSTHELGLVGHSGLASAYVAHTYLPIEGDLAILKSPVGGPMPTQRDGQLVSIELKPMSRSPRPARELEEAIGGSTSIVEALDSSFGPVAILGQEREVAEFEPDYERLALLAGALTISAPGDDVDFVSRVFPARPDFPEDPVCGTAHRILAPYWSEKLGRSRLQATQVSWRRGEFICEDLGDTVRLSGQCVEVMAGRAEL